MHPHDRPQATTKPQRKRRWLRRLVITLSILTLLWLASSLAVGYCLTHRLASAQPEPLPSVTWAQPEFVPLTTQDGITLGAWAADGHPNRPAILILHGNGATHATLQVLPGTHLQLRSAQPEAFDHLITDFAENPDSATTVPTSSTAP